MNKNIFIYIIKDTKFDYQIVYVGQTRDGVDRFHKHKHDAIKAKRISHLPIHRLISKREKEGFPVIFEIHEYCTLEQLNEREIYWIKFYRDGGTKLKNILDGGQGSPNMKWKEICSKAQQKARKNPNNNYFDVGSITRGKKLSDEVKRKISESAKQTLNRPEIREKLLKANRNRPPVSEEYKKRKSLSSPLKKSILCHQNQIIYHSIREASRQLKVSCGRIVDYLKGREVSKVNGKYTFEYIKNDSARS